jgi:uncharacterized membrane protein
MVTISNAPEVRAAVPGGPAPEDRADVAAQGVHPRSPVAGRRRFRYQLPGAWVAMVFVCLSFTPSLVPRPGVFQGVVGGIAGAIGYGAGVLGARVWGEFADRPARLPRARSWRVFLIAAPVMLLISFLFGQRWQGQIRDLMGADPEALGSILLAPVVAALVFVGLVAAGRPSTVVRPAGR